MHLQLRSVAFLLLVLAAACTSQIGSAAQQADVRYSSRVHKMPRNEANPTPGPSGAQLQYYGGHVISSVKVYEVLYGSGTYAPEISGSQMQSFYTQVVQSPFIDWLSEYDTNITAVGGQQGTNQHIGRGSFGSKVQLSPSSTNNGSTIDDSNIQAEINAQISAGHLPAPDANTLYMLHFPKGKSITQGGSGSCVSGGFCAYHGTFTRNGASVYYGVLPDMSSGSGCDTGCGNDATPFNNQSSVASHEFTEAITDAEVGLATGNAPPLAWYDQTNGEIGDICNAQQGTFVGANGVTYVVQQEWSNSQGMCVDHGTGTTPTNDFSLSLSPTSGSVAPGASTSFTVTTALVSGTAQSIALSVSGLPAGVTGSFSPSSVTAGGSSTLTIAASSSAAAASATLTVTGTASSGSHTATASLSVGTSSGPPPGGIVNGGFESGLTGWTTSGVTSTSSTAHSGTASAMVGSTSPSNDSSIAQTFTVPAGGATLSFWYQVVCPDTIQYDWASATLKDNTSGATTTLLANTCSSTGNWAQVTSGALTAGHSLTLTLANHDDNYAADPTYTLYDDVSLSGSAPPANDFSISVSPGSATLAAGASTTLSVSTAIASGSAESISLSVSGLPAGVSGSFKPASVTSGGSSTLTLTASSSAASASANLSVVGTASSGTHGASASLTVTGSGPPPAGIVNGGFETGTLSGWTASGVTSVSTTAHSGSYSAMVGGTSPSTDSSITQSFAVPSSGGTLTFWYQVVCPDTVQYDWASATLADETSGASTTLLANTCSSTGTWQSVTANLAANAGHNVTLTLANHDDNYPGDPTYTLYDDVALGGGSPPPANDFSLALSPGSATVAPGSAASFTVSTAVTSGSAQTITLSASGLPSGVSASFSPSSVSAGGSATLTLSASSSASGSATFTVTGSAASGTHTATASVSVSTPTSNDFSLSLSPASQTVAPGSSVAFTVSTAVTSGSAQTISLSAAGFPSGVTGSFSPGAVSAGQSSTLTVAASSSSTAGSATLTVTGSASSGSHSSTASLTVSGTSPGTGVGPNGGTVDHLYFAVVGDTRPGSVDATSSYPTAIITKIYQEIEGLNPRPQFVLGTGDYMFANASGTQAQPQVDLYMQARANYSGTFFPAMGNHECDGYTADNCTSTTQYPNIQAFMGSMLAPIGRTTPYYSFPVSATDGSWSAKFINIACNYWGSAQQTWLTSQLATSTTYTILTRHEPKASSTGPCVNTVETMMTSAAYDISLVGHTHTFQFTSGSKEIIIGNGGAPITGSAPYGFATVERLSSGWQIKEYDYSTGLAVNTYTLP